LAAILNFCWQVAVIFQEGLGMLRVKMRSHTFCFFLLMMTIVTMGAAVADPRDDVLSTASRCSIITDYRKWLDCYYGAAQSMRALLGLRPATEEQQRLSATAGTAIVTAPAMSSLQSGGGASQNQLGVRDPKVPPEQFGLAQKDTADHVAARMMDFTFDRAGIFTATLSNGQVWRQISGDTGHVRWEKSAQKMIYNVVVEHGALGSYNFRVEGQAGTYKVVRLR